jgi:predicted lipoprotein with Yx(FWY)xxD motif
MAQIWRIGLPLALFAQLSLSTAVMAAARGSAADHPAGIKIVETEMNGPVYADQKGRTLYTWYGDKQANKSECENVKITQVRGRTGVEYHLPDAETRLTCTQAWPPLEAAADEKPVGAWSIFTREDGLRQWSHSGKPVYRSHLDRDAGEVNGIGIGRGRGGRTPLEAMVGTPTGVTSVATETGRAFALNQGKSILYTNTKSVDCTQACADSPWQPFTASALATSQGDWSVVEDGRIRQWAYRGQLLYTFEQQTPGQRAEDENLSGWKQVVFKALPPRPQEVTIQLTTAGKAYADRAGRSLYVFDCNEEAPDQQLCDVEGTSARYRLGICGGPEKCKELYRPMTASRGAKAPGKIWTIVHIDRTMGAVLPREKSQEGEAVWAFRGRPVYTYVGDKGPGDTYGDGLQIYFIGSYEILAVDPDSGGRF